MILDHAYTGNAYRLTNGMKAKREQITGAFRLVRYGVDPTRGRNRTYVILGNGENPERFWQVYELGQLERSAPEPPDIAA